MKKKSLIHMAGNYNIALVVPKISAYHYDKGSLRLVIWMTGDKDGFSCTYSSLEELLSDVGRLDKSIKIFYTD